MNADKPILILEDETRSATDRRFKADVFDGIDNPLDVDGSGYAADIFNLMHRQIIRMPYRAGCGSEATSALRFKGNMSALDMMKKQAPITQIPGVDINADGAPTHFRGILIQAQP